MPPLRGGERFLLGGVDAAQGFAEVAAGFLEADDDVAGDPPLRAIPLFGVQIDERQLGHLIHFARPRRSMNFAIASAFAACRAASMTTRPLV